MNCGCPLDLVCDKGAGSALMMKPNKLRNAIAGMGNVFSGPVTVKMRTGWEVRGGARRRSKMGWEGVVRWIAAAPGAKATILNVCNSSLTLILF